MSRVGNEREWRWRIGVASALVGSAGVLAGLRQDLGLGWGLTLVAVTALGAMLALRGVHHRVEAERARRNVFDAGAGSTAWVMLLMGAAVVPGLVLNVIDDAGVRAVVEMQPRFHTTRGGHFRHPVRMNRSGSGGGSDPTEGCRACPHHGSTPTSSANAPRG